MPKYSNATDDLLKVAKDVIKTHHAAICHVKIDLLFAHGKRDENNNVVGDAIRHQGHKALALASKVSLLNRKKGMGDCQVLVDHDWWEKATSAEQFALLDHEFHHFAPVDGKFDELDRPIIKIRKHDVQIGWFSVVAKRNGIHSQERIQAKQLMDEKGQVYWPELLNSMAAQTRMGAVAQEVRTTG